MPQEDNPYVYQAWPSWAYGPDGEGQIFDSEAEVPAGWAYQGKTKGKAAKASPPPPPGDKSKEAKAPEGDVDAAGTPLDLERHTGTKTKSGLWRMKVGVSRPDGEGEDSPNYVKPEFDL